MEQNLQNLQLTVSIWKIIPTCCHRNKGEVEYILKVIYEVWELTREMLCNRVISCVCIKIRDLNFIVCHGIVHVAYRNMRSFHSCFNFHS